MALKLDSNFINTFIDGAAETLKVQCSVMVTPGKVYLKSKTNSQLVIDIAGLIGITSTSFCGSIAISFPQKTFLGVMESMLGEKYTEITKDVEDGAGELINIIFGTAKRVLNEQGYVIKKALPSVVKGLGLQIRSVSMAAVLVVPFESTVGPFQIEISVDENE
jgi:chemotaxis protein CheX